jgi:hypothetical protein
VEIRRLRRNPRAVIVPVIFFFAFALNKTNTAANYGHGNYTGAGVSVERAQGGAGSSG